MLKSTSIIWLFIIIVLTQITPTKADLNSFATNESFESADTHILKFGKQLNVLKGEKKKIKELFQIILTGQFAKNMFSAVRTWGTREADGSARDIETLQTMASFLAVGMLKGYFKTSDIKTYLQEIASNNNNKNYLEEQVKAENANEFYEHQAICFALMAMVHPNARKDIMALLGINPDYTFDEAGYKSYPRNHNESILVSKQTIDKLIVYLKKMDEAQQIFIDLFRDTNSESWARGFVGNAIKNFTTTSQKKPKSADQTAGTKAEKKDEEVKKPKIQKIKKKNLLDYTNHNLMDIKNNLLAQYNPEIAPHLIKSNSFNTTQQQGVNEIAKRIKHYLMQAFFVKLYKEIEFSYVESKLEKKVKIPSYSVHPDTGEVLIPTNPNEGMMKKDDLAALRKDLLTLESSIISQLIKLRIEALKAKGLLNYVDANAVDEELAALMRKIIERDIIAFLQIHFENIVKESDSLDSLKENIEYALS